MRRILTLTLALTLLFVVVSPSVFAEDSPFPNLSSAVLQNAAAATGGGTPMDTTRSAVAVLQTSGTFVGTVTYQGTADGTTWSTLTCYTIGTSTGVTTATTAAAVRCNVGGWAQIRANVTAYTSGAITVKGNATSFGYPFAATNN